MKPDFSSFSSCLGWRTSVESWNKLSSVFSSEEATTNRKRRDLQKDSFLRSRAFQTSNPVKTHDRRPNSKWRLKKWLPHQRWLLMPKVTSNTTLCVLFTFDSALAFTKRNACPLACDSSHVFHISFVPPGDGRWGWLMLLLGLKLALNWL